MKDPSAFKERFNRWKEGVKVYDAGRAVDEYELFKLTLPENQRNPSEYEYSPLTQHAYKFTRLVPTLIDRALWAADVAGAPSHITNAVRDFSNRAANEPVILANAVYNYLNGDMSFKEAYKLADVKPHPLAQMFEVMPKVNTDANYSNDELAAMYELGLASGGRPGQITYKGYREANQGRYAGDINEGDFLSPNKVLEWSIGLTSGLTDENGEPYTSDLFAYDTKDTRGIYLKRALEGDASAVMWLRGLLGIQGSKGYNDNTNSKTSIRTRVPVKAQRAAYDKKYHTASWDFGKSIHINPANRSKFNATKKRTGKTTEELTHSKNPLTRKRAIFAKNARKWNH